MTRPASNPLTIPDLVILSLLSEKPMHGYQMVLELERREVRDWAGISRPQIYYSLRKLARAGLIRLVRDPGTPAGPERDVYAPTAAAGKALANALEREDWATQRPPPPFLTWAVLSIHARSRTLGILVGRRRAFLREQIVRETSTLEAIRRDRGPLVSVAAAIVDLAIRQFELEKTWLDDLARALRRSRRRVERPFAAGSAQSDPSLPPARRFSKG